MFDWAIIGNALSNFHFIRPWWLLLLTLVVVGWWYARKVNDPTASWQNIIAPHLLKAMLVRRGTQRWFNPLSASLIVVALAVIILAGPSWERRPSPFTEDHAVLVIGLDLSETMKQQDIQPSRLERGKQKVMDLMDLRGGARTGLIVYSGSAHTVIPLTNDPDVIRNFLAALTVDMMPVRGKFPEKVIPLASRMFDDSMLPGTLLLISDGVGSDSITSFSEYFSTVQHQFLVLGVGKEEVVAVDEELAAQLDTNYFPLQTQQLQQLADAGGGYYQPLTIGKEDVQRINRRIKNHLLSVDDSDRPWVDVGYFLLFPLALIFLLWFRKGWTLHWCLALVALGGLSGTGQVQAQSHQFMDLWLTPDQQGRYYFEQGNYDIAQQRFVDPAWKGIAYYYDENFTAAVEMFTRIESVDGLFNLANAWAQSQNYVYAVQTYDRLLEIQPDHPSAIKNRAFVQAIIDEINLMSESQQAEPGEDSTEMGDDQPLRAEGAERKDMNQPKEIEQFTADQLLADEKIEQMWLKQIQRDPSQFLSVKFAMQYEREHASDKLQN
ncbi:MAG: VWA domain-containing protein [Pseudomonadales bacterium]